MHEVMHGYPSSNPALKGTLRGVDHRSKRSKHCVCPLIAKKDNSTHVSVSQYPTMSHTMRKLKAPDDSFESSGAHLRRGVPAKIARTA